MTATPAIEGWFTVGDAPALLGSRCAECSTVYFPPVAGFCRNPACDGEGFETAELSRRGTVWSYTDAHYQPPAPYVPRGDAHVPFALAAVELPEGLVVLGQVADGFGVADLEVGAEVELVVEELCPGELIWRWRPVQAGETS
jgi:uncharacterized OB-fold protein